MLHIERRVQPSFAGEHDPQFPRGPDRPQRHSRLDCLELLALESGQVGILRVAGDCVPNAGLLVLGQSLHRVPKPGREAQADWGSVG